MKRAWLSCLDDVFDDALAELVALEPAPRQALLEVGVAAGGIALQHLVIAAECAEHARGKDVEAAQLVVAQPLALLVEALGRDPREEAEGALRQDFRERFRCVLGEDRVGVAEQQHFAGRAAAPRLRARQFEKPASPSMRTTRTCGYSRSMKSAVPSGQE